MRYVLKIVLALTITCGACAFSLAFVSRVTKDKIEQNARKRIEDAIMRLAPETKKIEEVKAAGGIYQLYDAKNSLVSLAFLAEGDGYQGKIKMLGVIAPSLERMQGVEIIDSVETPGLGARIAEDFFKDQFKTLRVAPAIECVKDKVSADNQISAITGATISSRAVANIMNKRVAELKTRFGK